ncbi:MBL fold metallo-hydrolase [Fictibacillus nanhaiensis]|uniref:MBL fold metallo-hydrolase n=1 Tax=Fictibacillus nanhaiensis TaxID=742169 RepID=UPI001C969E15|nr:MBL fold metallo-hydrolase [Fictibacillus nanhaiensis]MBY6036559.1 MBL fold metallo-hydrolase [Fictibacillus nanhaiensis]
MFVLFIFIVVIISVILFLNFHPVFGRKPHKETIAVFNELKHHSKGRFVNQIPTEMANDFRTMLPVLKEYLKGNPDRQPKDPLPIESLQLSHRNVGKESTLTWFGHSAFLLEMDGKRVLIDPMFGKAPSPAPWFGNKRYSKKLPFRIEELPSIDLVILSHDHYDHLDYGSIKKLQSKVRQFIVPLGVGGHLERWGVNSDSIRECNWWDSVEFENLSIVCTPARHFSGRGLRDRNTTLWCSWAVKGQDTNLYFSGDSGYGPHFKEIGEKLGPFDVTLMECGQYHEKWSSIHMIPEETIQAHLDVKGRTLIPIHWGAFTLSLHDWTDPVERAIKAAKKYNVAISTPRIGEIVKLDREFPQSTWWK